MTPQDDIARLPREQNAAPTQEELRRHLHCSGLRMQPTVSIPITTESGDEVVLVRIEMWVGDRERGLLHYVQAGRTLGTHINPILTEEDFQAALRHEERNYGPVVRSEGLASTSQESGGLREASE